MLCHLFLAEIHSDAKSKPRTLTRLPDISDTSFHIFLKNIVFIFISQASYREKEDRERSFNPLIYSPHGCIGWNWAGSKPRARNFWVSHLGAGAQRCGSSFAAFPGFVPLAEIWIESRVAGTPVTAHMEFYCCRQKLGPIDHVLITF